MRSLTNYQIDHRIKQKISTVYLEFDPLEPLTIWYCSKCRQPIMQFQGHLVMELPSGQMLNPYTVSLCTNRDCGRKYRFAFINW